MSDQKLTPGAAMLILSLAASFVGIVLIFAALEFPLPKREPVQRAEPKAPVTHVYIKGWPQ